MAASAGIVQLACTPRYTDVAASWVTQESDHAYSLWFNPSQGLSLEDLARTVEAHARDLTQLLAQNSPMARVNLDIQIQRFTIRAQVYARQYLPNYKAADVLRDRETFNVLVWQRAAVSPKCVIS